MTEKDGPNGPGEVDEIAQGVTDMALDKTEQLLEAFHAACTEKDGETAAESAASALALRLAQPRERGQAALLVQKMEEAWKADNADDAFKQRASEYGARMYASAVYELLNGEAQTDDEKQQAIEFYISQVWMVGSTQEGAVRGTTQGLLRLLAADQRRVLHGVLKKAVWERLLMLLGQPDTDARSLGMLVASQVAASARNPENSAGLSGYDPKSRGDPVALARARTLTSDALDGWVQSTTQASRRQGLLAAAALYEAGTDLASGLWTKDGWMEDLWDQGEFDREDTQVALLRLADACAADAKVSTRMRQLGSELVQALARSKSGEAGVLAGGVLAKWATLPVKTDPTKKDSAEAEPASTNNVDPEQLADMHAARIIAGDSGMAQSAEALGYLCLKPEIKEHVAQNSQLLKALFAQAIKSDETDRSELAALRFATVMLMRNLTQPRAIMSEEQKRLQQLQSRAAGGTGGSKVESESPLDDTEHVARRAVQVCAAGGVGVLVTAVQPRARASDGMKDAVAGTVAALAMVPPLRGQLVQQGAARAVLEILTDKAPRAQDSAQAKEQPRAQALTPRDHDVAAALARMAISVPPHLAFHDARHVARLLLALAADENATQALLLRFEALLALTNLASADPGSSGDLRSYIYGLGGMTLAETSMLSGHPMVRRAATELVCNMVQSPECFEHFARGADRLVDEEEEEPDLSGPRIVELDDDHDTKGHPDAYRGQHLHLLVALADVDDAPTRSAASGALAILSTDVRCCRYLFLVHPRAAAVLLDLAANEDVGLKHRVAVIWANAAACGDAAVRRALSAQTGLLPCLRAMAKDSDAPYHAAVTSVLAQIEP